MLTNGQRHNDVLPNCMLMLRTWQSMAVSMRDMPSMTAAFERAWPCCSTCAGMHMYHAIAW